MSVAGEFVRLSYAGPEPDPLTNLRLQKLLYYAQGWSFAIRGSNLFPEKFQARQFGPVIGPVYSASGRGKGVIGEKEFAGAPALDDEEAKFVRAVWEAYSPFSASSLSRKAREEAPWRDAWGDRPADFAGAVPMPAEAIFDYFVRQPVPGPIADHKQHLRELEQLARERLAAAPPLDLDAFAAMAAGGKRPARAKKP